MTQLFITAEVTYFLHSPSFLIDSPPPPPSDKTGRSCTLRLSCSCMGHTEECVTKIFKDLRRWHSKRRIGGLASSQSFFWYDTDYEIYKISLKWYMITELSTKISRSAVFASCLARILKRRIFRHTPHTGAVREVWCAMKLWAADHIETSSSQQVHIVRSNSGVKLTFYGWLPGNINGYMLSPGIQNRFHCGFPFLFGK